MAYLGRKGAAAPINASDIPDDSITSAKILADAVGSSDLAPDIALTGGSVGIPSVTTANRPGESGGTNASQTATVGMLIYNSTIGMLQQYNASGWASIDSPPTVTSLNYPGDDTALDTVGEYNDATCDYDDDETITHDTNTKMAVGMSVSGTGIPVGATIASVTSTTAFELSASTTGGAVTNGTLTFNTQTLIISGSNFQASLTVTIDGTAPSTVSRDSSTQITVTGTPAKTAGTKVDGLVVTNLSGLSASIDVDYSPLPGWSSPASGNLLSDFNGLITEIALTGGADTVSYAITTGQLPTGLTIGTVDGDINGTMNASAATYIFTVDAIDAQAQSSPRLFNIISKGALPTGGIISTYTGFRVHKFISAMSQSFDFECDGDLTIGYVIIAGGGGGGWGTGGRGGGGGAGGIRYNTGAIVNYALAAGSYTIVVGTGGGEATASNDRGDSGLNSSFDSIIASGGGGGASVTSPGTGGGDGGSGGGGGASSVDSPGSGNVGNHTPVEGYDGTHGQSGNWAGGAGGGAGGIGTVGVSNHTGGNGGVGASTFVNGSASDTADFLWSAQAGTNSSNAATSGLGSNPGTLYIAGGGGGSCDAANNNGGLGGNGGGGRSLNDASDSVEPVINTGSGGFGQRSGQGDGTGANGIVIIRYAV